MRHSPAELMARREITRVLSMLPANLRAEADQCVIELCDAEADLLGLFEGLARHEGTPQSPDDLPRIRLFIATIWDYTDRDPQAFREEIRITLLHELGHYLGLDEAQVAALGLA